MRGLEGRTVLITGAARGMGRAAARRFVEEGARVVCADILDDEAKQVADELGDRAIHVHLDVSDEADWAAAVEATTREFGSLEVLVNNAGILSFSAIADMPREDYETLVQVNQVGVFLGMKHASPAIIASGDHGSIVNVSSVEGLGGGAYLVGYTATKFAVRGMTKAAAWELGPRGVRVNSIHPGAILTPMVSSQPGFGPEAEKFVAGRTALKRFGQPEEVAALMAFLASDDASYVTGAEISVDGGVAASSGFTV